MLILLIVLFSVSSRISLNTLTLKDHITHITLIIHITHISWYCPVLQHCIPTLCFSPCLFNPRPSWISNLLWLVSSHMPEPAPQTPTEQLCWIKSHEPNQWWGINYATVWHDDVAWCHKDTELKVGLLTWCMKSRILCGGEELLLVWSLAFLMFRTFYMQNYRYKTLEEKKKIDSLEKCATN